MTCGNAKAQTRYLDPPESEGYPTEPKGYPPQSNRYPPQSGAEVDQQRKTNSTRRTKGDEGTGGSGGPASDPIGEEASPPAAGEPGGEVRQERPEQTSHFVARPEGGIAARRAAAKAAGGEEISPAVSSPKYRNCLKDSADAEKIVRLWESLWRPPPRSSTRDSWLKSARHLIEDGHPVDEICGLVRWVAADAYWSRRISSPHSLRLDNNRKPRYADLLAESKERTPRLKNDASASEPDPESKKRAAEGFGKLSGLGGPRPAVADSDDDNAIPARHDSDFASLRAKLGQLKDAP